jgi:threonine dehydrogenase-like Zn-dependent dehydrogenase
MRAFVWDGQRASIVADHPEPSVGAGMALVGMRLAGICSTDLQILAGYMGFHGVLGHEFVGEVLEGPGDLVGRRVAGEINFACGRCTECDAGHPRHCPNRTVLGILGADGAFAERLVVPVENLHVLPDSIDDAAAIFIEPLAAAFEAEIQSRAFAGARTVVLGAGKLGLLCAQVLARRGDDVRVVCRHEAAVRIVRKLGLEPILGTLPQKSAELVVEATGHPEGLATALAMVRPLGAVVQKSTVAARHNIDLAPLVINEVSLIGSRCGPFVPAIDALARGEIAVAPLLTDTRPLSAAGDAIDLAKRPGVLKIALDPAR